GEECASDTDGERGGVRARKAADLVHVEREALGAGRADAVGGGERQRVRAARAGLRCAAERGCAVTVVCEEETGGQCARRERRRRAASTGDRERAGDTNG